MLDQVSKGRRPASSVSIFSGKIQCGDCRDWYGPKLWHSKSEKYRRTVLQCNSKFKNKCRTPHFTEEEIEKAFMYTVSRLVFNRKQIKEDFEEIKRIAYDTTDLEIERDKLYAELESISKRMEDAISENARVALDQEEYNRHFNEMTDRFNSVREKYDQLTAQIEDKKSRLLGAEQFIKTLLSEGKIKEFSPMLWHSLLDHAIVARDGEITFVFKNGMEL